MTVGREKLAAEEVVEISVLPSGFSRLTVTELMVLPVSCTVACWPDVALKVSLAFCPGPGVTVTAAPPGVILCVITVESYSVTVALPLDTMREYVPETGRRYESIKQLVEQELVPV